MALSLANKSLAARRPLKIAAMATRLTAERLFGDWDAARVSWDRARNQGHEHLTEIANAAMSMGHLSPGQTTPEKSRVPAYVADSTEAKCYETLLMQHRLLFGCLDGLLAAVVAMERVAEIFATADDGGAQQSSPQRGQRQRSPQASPQRSPQRSPLQRSQQRLFVTHDAASIGGVVAEAAAMYRSQYEACVGVVEANDPDVARASDPSILTLRSSVWLMEPMIEVRRLEVLDRIRRTELDPLSKDAFLGRR